MSEMDDDVEITDVNDDDVPFQVTKASLKNQDLSSLNLIGNLKLYIKQIIWCIVSDLTSETNVKRQIANS